MDTKGAELEFLAEQIAAAGIQVVTVDVGTHGPASSQPIIQRETIARCHPDGTSAVLGQTDRGRAVAAMGEALRLFLLRECEASRVAGVIGIGGSGGTALATTALRALPIGLPKVMVSTVASGNVGPYVGCSDIVMMYSVVDVAGLNNVSRRILANAAHAIAGMVAHPPLETTDRPTIGMTMFGVTTPCVDAVRHALESEGFDCLVFHATGAGGRAMEKLVDAGLITGVLDITTTEVADEVIGGVFAAGPERFDAIVRHGIPYVASVGALDMVNFGSPDSVPDKFKARLFHIHNAQVTLMRTTSNENRQFARWMAAKLNQSTTPMAILIPENGISALDAPGQPFHDPQADAGLFDELEAAIHPKGPCIIRRLPFHINDRGFAEALVTTFLELWQAAARRR